MKIKYKIELFICVGIGSAIGGIIIRFLDRQVPGLNDAEAVIYGAIPYFLIMFFSMRWIVRRSGRDPLETN